MPITPTTMPTTPSTRAVESLALSSEAASFLAASPCPVPWPSAAADGVAEAVTPWPSAEVALVSFSTGAGLAGSGWPSLASSIQRTTSPLS